MIFEEYECILEAILFAWGEPLSLDEIALCLETNRSTARKIVVNFKDKLEQKQRGIQIIEINGAYQMCASPNYYPYIKKIVGETINKPLSGALLETLAIIAYKQPISKSEIEAIRGVDAAFAVNKLIEKKLVCEKGRLDQPGKPIGFGTTDEFLRFFGLSSIHDLPPLEDKMIGEDDLDGFLF